MSSRAAPRRDLRLPRARIELGAVIANCRLAARLAPGSKVMAVVKADAYGHGAVEVARVLAEETDALGVARLDEALELRAAGLSGPIVVLQGCLAPWELKEVVAHGLEIVVHSEDQLVEVTTRGRSAVARVWLKLDSGMHRLGLGREEFRRARQRLAAAAVPEIVLMSHLATADELESDFVRRQTERFVAATRGLDESRSLANSAAILTRPESHFDWIRPGIMLYGASPLDRSTPQADELEPVMQFETEVIAVRDLVAGDSVGYGRRFVCDRPTRVATVAAGYGDGYPRHAPDGTPVLVGGHRVRLAGRVSMDSLTVDLIDHPGLGVGAAVELWGRRLPVAEVAAAAGTISYDLLTGVTSRVAREYLPPPA